MDRKKIKYILFIIIVGGLALRLMELKEPWIGLRDFNGALHTQIAKNYVRFGYLETALGPVTNFEPNPEEFTYYLHHPILLNLILSIFVKVFGPAEWAMRLLPVLTSTAEILLIFILVRMLWGEVPALFSSLFLAFIPMTGYFGRMVNNEAVVSPIMISLMIFYVRKSRHDRIRDTAAFYVLLLIGLLMDWSIYYVAGYLFIHRVIFGKRNLAGLIRSAAPPLMAIAVFGLFLFHGWYLTGSLGHNLLTVFLERVGAVPDLMAKGSYYTVLRRFLYFFTPITVFLSAIFLFREVFKNGRCISGDGSILIILYLIAITHILLFREAALLHEYYLYYFSAPIVISSALGLDHILTAARREWQKKAILVLVLVGFIPLSVLRVQSVHKISRFEDIPDLGEWLQKNTASDDEILVIGPPLSYFGYSQDHFAYYHGPIHTKPWPHLGFYTCRKIRWSVRDLEELEQILMDPGRLEYAVLSIVRIDPIIEGALEILSSQAEEIRPDEWGKDDSVLIRIFKLRSENRRH